MPMVDKFISSIAPKIAVIGSGPSGLYFCTRILQKMPSCRIDVFDKSAAPYGLVQYGVAPDHPEMRRCYKGFERMFHEYSQRLSLFCNVAVGTDLTYHELCNLYEIVVLAYGANVPRKLGLENERAINCFSGSDFVSWYNGHPSTSPASPLLECSNALIIGNGNVALDCARILLTPASTLEHTDMPEPALNRLRTSKIKNVRVLGRRGPREISFTIKELRELLNMDCKIHINIPVKLCEELAENLQSFDRPRRRLLELMLKSTKSKFTTSERNLIFEFFTQPEKIHLDETGRVSGLEIFNTRTNKRITLECGLLIYAIGFKNFLLEGLPKTDDGQLLVVDGFRVPSKDASVYAIGWCSHNARGLIADSQAQAFTAADHVIEDWENYRIERKPNDEEVKLLLEHRNIPYINWQTWCYIDECERRMGSILGKPREKIINLPDFFRVND